MKNIILINNRSLHFYDFKELKENHSIKISVLVFEEQKKDLSKNIKDFVDKIYFLPQKNTKFDPIFSEKSIRDILYQEINHIEETWLVGTDELHNLEVAFLREEFNLPGIPSSIILNYRNKLIQKQLLNNKVKIPKFCQLNREKYKENPKIVYNNLHNDLNLPFILKPINMYGSLGVRKINSYENLKRYIYDFSYLSNFIAEEYINGQLYHCDFIIQNGVYIFSEVSEYLKNGLSFLDGYNHGSLILLKTNSLRNKIIDFCKNANIILGLNNGCAHFEVFVTNDQEIIFLEAAARPAGSMVPVVFSKMFQQNFLNQSLLAEINEPVEVLNDIHSYSFWILFPQKEGIVKKINKPLLKSFNELNWLIKEGDFLNKPEGLKHKIGSLLATNKNYDDLKEDFDSLKNFKAL